MVVHFSSSVDTECTLQVEDEKVFYWEKPQFLTDSLFIDFVTDIVETVTNRDTERFIQLLDPYPALWDELRRCNQKRVKWSAGDDFVCSRIRETCSSVDSVGDIIFPSPPVGKIRSVDVLINNQTDPTGELRKIVNRLIASTKTESDDESETAEEPVEGFLDNVLEDEYLSDEEEETDQEVQAKPESPCYYPSQIEMAAILKKRIDTIMRHYHNISRLGDAFHNIEFVVYTARYRMLSDQTEKRMYHPDAGVLSKEELESVKHCNGKKRMFMYVRSAETEKHFEDLKKDVQEKPQTLFVIIADECHWGITKDKEENPSAHNLYINDWCRGKLSPRNVIVVQISATPFNVLTKNSRLPVVRCVIPRDEISTTQGHYKAGDLVVLDREPDLDEHVKNNSKEVELHVVHWSEVEIKNFERGMRMKLKSTLQIKDAPYLCVSLDGKLGVTPIENDATDFIVQGSHGIVILKALAKNDQIQGKALTIIEDDVNLKAKINPPRATKFEVKMDFGVGVVAFGSCEKSDRYIAVDETGYVSLQAAKVERKCGVAMIKPKHDLAKVSFLFYSDQSSPMEVGTVGSQYMSLNYYLSTINSNDKHDQKIREDKRFQDIVDKTKREKKKSPTNDFSFPIDALLCAEYCYHIINVSVFDSDEKMCKALSSSIEESPAAEFQRKLNWFLEELESKETTQKKFIDIEAFKLVRKEIWDEVSQSFENNLKQLAKLRKHTEKKQEIREVEEELATSFVACLMHLSQEEIQQIEEKINSSTIRLNIITSKLQENSCQALVKRWRNIVQSRETSSLVANLIQSGKGELGKMKIIRAKNMKTADQFYYTLRLARTVSSLQDCFEVIKDYGGIQIKKQLMKSTSPFFVRLQPPKCAYKFGCPCPNLRLQSGRKKCANCDHVHKLITQYEDLENLACVLILVEKGRMGDTFPKSFDCLDLRLNYDCSREFKEGSLFHLSTLIQELGRLCRFSSTADRESPYVLVGRELLKRLRKSLETSPSINAISCTKADRYMVTSRSSKETKDMVCSSLRWLDDEAHKDSYDHQNEEKHFNRILLQAEPQIGKTGTYLCLVKDLRLDILGKEKVLNSSSATLDEGNFYEYKEWDSSLQLLDCEGEEKQDWKFPLWKTIKSYPSLNSLPVAAGKYSIGGFFYTHDTEENPYYLVERKAQNPTRSAYRYKKKDVQRDDLQRAWSWCHFEDCGECGRLLQCNESVIKTLEVNIDDSVVAVQYSTPSSRPLYGHLLDKPESNGSTEEAFSELDLKYWIFHPSHRDDPRKCILNYNHVMKQSGRVANYIQVAVVRSEKFEAYRATWGKVLAIFQLPEKLPQCKLGPSEGGVGYARLFIQKLAFSLGLEYIFVIDDNMALMSEAKTDDSSASEEMVSRDENGVMMMQRCSFLEPLIRLQKIAQGLDITSIAGRKYDLHPLSGVFEDQQYPLYKYTGPAKLFGDSHESYGVLGLMRSVPNAKNPFSKTQVYAFILLNVKSTVEKGVFYRPWPCWEDLRFNDDCDKAGLWVVKCNRYHFLKVQYKDWINNLVPLSLFKWKDDTFLVEKKQDGSELPEDLEEDIILEHLRELVESQGLENCFKGRIGNYVQDDGKDTVSPLRIVDQIKARDLTQEDIDNGVPIIILSYFVLNPDRENLNRLDSTFCSTKERIVFVTSAKEVVEEWPHISVSAIKKIICQNREMKERNAQFDLFSAADPCKHRVRYLLIEASFPKADEEGQEERTINKTEDTLIARQSSSLRFLQHKSNDSKSRVKRSLQELPKESAPSKRQKVKNNLSQQGAHYTVEEINPSSIKNLTPVEDLQRDISPEKDNILVEEYSHEVSQGDNELLKNSKVKRMKIDLVAEHLPHKHEELQTKLGSGEGYHGQMKNVQEESNCSNIVSVDSMQNQGTASSKMEADKKVLLTKTADEDGSAQNGDDSNVSNASGGQGASGRKTESRSFSTKKHLNVAAHMEGTNPVTGIIVNLWTKYRDIQGYSTMQIQKRGSSDLTSDEIHKKLQCFSNKELQDADEKGYNALLKACSLPSMSPHVMQYLITTQKVDLNCRLPSNFDINHPTAKGLMPGMSSLSVAVRKGNVKSVPTFMTRPTDINVRSVDDEGNTALHHCVISISKTSFQKLFPLFKPLEWKEMRNNDLKNPLDVCVALEEQLKRQEKVKENSLKTLTYMKEEMEKVSASVQKHEVKYSQ